MKLIRFGIVLAVMLAVLQVSDVSHVYAQATRTWVSGVGDDANPCSRTAPCKTFAGAISKTAANGEINCLDNGGFGAVTITKSMTISCPGVVAGVVASGTNGIVVNTLATDVVILRHLDINGLGTGLNGIRFIGGGVLIVEDTQIYSFNGGTALGIDFAPAVAGSRLYVTDSMVRDNGVLTGVVAGGGIRLKPTGVGTATATIDNVNIEANATGLRVEANATATARGTTSSGNLQSGFIAISTGAAAVLNLYDCVAAGNLNAASNGTGVNSNGAGATIRIRDVMSTNNNIGLGLFGGAILSFGENYIAGNTNTQGAPTGNIGPV